MNYGNFDTAKRTVMRSRIEHAIQTLEQWTHYVSSGSSPPSRRSSSGELAGAALPGGQYLDGPHHANQWGSSNQESSSLSRSRPQSKGKNRMSGADLTEAALAGAQYLDAPHHASQWGSQSQEVPGLSRSRPQSKGKSKSSNGSSSRNASRPASRAASRRNTPEQTELFIPPEIEPYDEEDAVDRYAQHYDHDRGRSTTYASAREPAQGAWGAAPAGRSRVHTIHDPVASSHPLLANGVTGGGASSSPWGGQSQNRAADPYSMHVLDQAIGGGPPPPGTTPEYARGPNFAGVGAGFPPVIPGFTVPDPAQVQQQQQRRRAEKQRKLERQRARGSKWRSDTESDEDDAYSDDDGDKENRMRDQRQRRDPAPAKGSQGGAWHQLYASPMGRSTSGGPQGGGYAPDRGPERGFAPFAQGQNPSGRADGRAQGRASSRPPSRNEPSDNKRRPPPLDLESPFIPPGQGPEFADPARIAQWQFEQQQKNYQLEREQQLVLAERERLYYQRPQFSQVPAVGQPPHPQMQMQMHYQQQQHHPQPPQQHHPLYQHPQMYQQQMQMQMQRGIYR
ncbi:hypothetical protein HYPSUDRAFT_1056402 [Hypholoma sublateritium FD-334 SS-4]|uniref:Uncharacterized protein n=1 Tax=Hypholoma sublateritium (strain FD-334 SS-4) TaxID=945553 RepID=A0A0D2NJM5_HYPSF|nr:hypothetical protein HYPSUDRAFT_1056402 [Hypholoma sublateritium FD-334 SS-4]